MDSIIKSIPSLNGEDFLVSLKRTPQVYLCPCLCIEVQGRYLKVSEAQHNLERCVLVLSSLYNREHAQRHITKLTSYSYTCQELCWQYLISFNPYMTKFCFICLWYTYNFQYLKNIVIKIPKNSEADASQFFRKSRKLIGRDSMQSYVCIGSHCHSYQKSLV